MSFGPGHPLAYPLAVTCAALVMCVAWLPAATLDQASAVAVVMLGILAYTAFRCSVATRRWAPQSEVRRIRQQYRLTSRSWIEWRDGNETRWTPVYFDPSLVVLPSPADVSDHRLYPSGRTRTREPVGRLIENPTTPDATASERGRAAARPRRRLLLDAQPAVAAPLAALLWTYVAGGGVGAFLGATTVAAAAIIWLSAIRGSDPS